MTMTGLVKANSVFRDAVKKHTRRPAIDKAGARMSEPRSKRYGLVGTAFDYLVGFTIEHLSPERTARPPLLTAEKGLMLLKRHARTETDRENVLLCERSLANMVNQAVRYVASGSLTPEFAGSILQVAQLDQVYRAGRLPRLPLPKGSKANIEDLLAMHARMPIDQLTARQKAYVSPDFGGASTLVGGADADFIIDGRLLDTKTSMELSIPLDMWCQIVGYYLLNRIESSVGGRIIDIHSLGIYFARYGRIVEIDVEDSISEPELLTQAMMAPSH